MGDTRPEKNTSVFPALENSLELCFSTLAALLDRSKCNFLALSINSRFRVTVILLNVLELVIRSALNNSPKHDNSWPPTPF